MDSGNWEVEPSTLNTNNQYYINVCRTLVKQKSQYKALQQWHHT